MARRLTGAVGAGKLLSAAVAERKLGTSTVEVAWSLSFPGQSSMG